MTFCRERGEPLPHQLADRSRAPPKAPLGFNLSAYGVLASVSRRCPPLQDSFSCYTHPSAAPLAPPHLCFRNVVAQLACVTHAASVYPEPGSNSQLMTLRLVLSSKARNLPKLQAHSSPSCLACKSFVKLLPQDLSGLNFPVLCLSVLHPVRRATGNIILPSPPLSSSNAKIPSMRSPPLIPEKHHPLES